MPKDEKIKVVTTDKQLKKKWFGLGTVIEAKTIDEILEQGGLAWEVTKRPMTTCVSIPVFDQEDKAQRFPRPLHPQGTRRNLNILDAAKKLLAVEKLHTRNSRVAGRMEAQAALEQAVEDLKKAPFIPMPRNYAVVRNDTGYPLGVLGAGYSCIPNRDSLAILETLLSEDRVKVERAGTFNGGANCWVVAQLPQSIRVGPDIMDQYIKIGWSHDGSEKLSATFIAYMRKSNVQLSPAINNTRVSIEIRHTKNAAARIKIAEQILGEGEAYFSAVEEKLNELISSSMTAEEMEDYLKVLLPDPPEKMAVDKHGEKVNKASTRNENSRERILEIFAHASTQTSHTKYAGLMAVATWSDQERTVRVTSKTKTVNGESNEDNLRIENRLQGIWQKSGSARNMKENAFAAIFEN